MIVFGLLAATPGDPARRILATRGVDEPTAAQLRAMRTDLGLDEPLPLRFLEWLTGLATGDLGLSWRTGRPVADAIAERLPATLTLTTAALLIALAVSVALALLAASSSGRTADHLTRATGVVMLALPTYVLGTMMLDVVAVRLGWGRVLADGSWATVALPALTLALAPAVAWSRVLRATLLELRTATFVEVAATRGASPLRRMLVHRLPNALAPYLAVVGMGAAGLIGGAPVAETVFSWPGVGRLAVEAITARDMPVVTAFTMLAVIAYVGMSLLVDLVVATIDPRVRSSGLIVGAAR